MSSVLFRALSLLGCTFTGKLDVDCSANCESDQTACYEDCDTECVDAGGNPDEACDTDCRTVCDDDYTTCDVDCGSGD